MLTKGNDVGTGRGLCLRDTLRAQAEPYPLLGWCLIAGVDAVLAGRRSDRGGRRTDDWRRRFGGQTSQESDAEDGDEGSDEQETVHGQTG